ncbi:two-component system sensor histidine kinase ChvG [Martelella mangrovi]|uniref:histidine kinase n=2 Tax=Martelella mangrovi TaxID=1397477 RepID=A0ABV2I5L5_9HYPH
MTNTSDKAESRKPGRRWRKPFAVMRWVLASTVFSSLNWRILFFNLLALFFLVGGILYLNQFREGLIDARVESLLTQGEIIAGAIASSASVETDTMTIDPQKLLELQAGESARPTSSDEDLRFPLNPEKVAPILRRLISPTRTRARIYDPDANLILDSRYLYSRGQVLRYDLPDTAQTTTESISDRLGNLMNRFLQPGNLPRYEEAPGGDGSIYPEVTKALDAQRSAVVRVTDKGRLIVSVAVPIQRFRAVLGVLLLSTQAGDIDKIVHAERIAIIRVFGVTALVTMILSFMLSSTIASPLRRLSEAAVRVRRGGPREREEIPDFSARQDEIGHLSTTLREMTTALYDRIDAIDSFAADVAHELKNPLTSLRSAVETLPLAKTKESKARLTEIIQHDVRRLDRLISDISDASRLDAELAREDAKRFDAEVLLKDLITISRETGRRHKPVEIGFSISPENHSKGAFETFGHDLRIGQIVTNLIENARSFVPETGGRIDVTLARARNQIIITVDDNGPGIRPDAVERIFERFYTDRPDGEAFGQNSGLGLSISRQIAEAHGGTLTAENIIDPDSAPDSDAGGDPDDTNIKGARFTLTLPAAGGKAQ